MQFRVGFLGAGAMAEALIKGVLQAGLLEAGLIFASDPSSSRLTWLAEQYGINTCSGNEQLVSEVDVIILAVKPQVVREAISPLQHSFRQGQMMISIAAGITLPDLSALLPFTLPLIRVMPNTPCLVGEGASALALGDHVSEEHLKIAEAILGAVGKTIVLSEKYLDAVTGLSGSGPAYVYLFIEALSDAGVRVGLNRDTALFLAAQTVLGAAKMVLETGKHPAVLKDMVTSPGGTTIAAVHALEEGGIRAALMNAVVAARDRSLQLREE
ncbi:MAG: pyrroline-5-carboxylate reductase [Bacillota bacterium]